MNWLYKLLFSLHMYGVIPDSPASETPEAKEARERREQAIREEALIRAKADAEAALRRGTTLGERANRVTDAALNRDGRPFAESAKLTMKEAGAFLFQGVLWSAGAAAVG